jgi:anti-sigma B factor antagonist
MKFTQTEHENYYLIEIIGRIDSYTAPKIEKAITTLIQSQHENIVVNLENVSYLSSSGILVFVNAMKKIISKDSGRIVFANTPELIYSAFSLSGFDNFFNFYPDLSNAVESFQKA